MNAPKTDVQKLNEELARRINREARSNPNSPYRGKYVGIANGRIVVVADTPEEAIHEMNRLIPDPSEGLVIDADADYDSVHYVWEV